jgi:AcrR family transcriptional regulator
VSRPRLAPRKRPRQRRSRETVDAIVEAAAYILVRGGPAKLTTNAIAARAGVNIASLYQYFPGKEAIVAELRRRHVAAQRAAVRAAWPALEGGPVERSVRALVSLGLAAHAVAPKLHRALAELVPGRVEVDDDAGALRARFGRELARAGVPDADLALWLIDTAAHAAIHRAAIERPELLDDPAFRDELVALIMGYVTHPRGPAGDGCPAR